MPVTALHHYTLRCTPDELPALTDFYTRVLGLAPGPRPVLPAPGAWLYAGGAPVVHLYALASERPADGAGTGALDHIALRGQDLADMRNHLQALGVPYTEAPVPGWPLHQIFLTDPTGLKIELTFQLDTENAGAAR